MKNIFKLICIFIILVSGVFLYKAQVKQTYHPKKVSLKVKAINFYGEGFDAEVPAVWEILQEKYDIQLVNDNYDILIIGPVENSPIPDSKDNIVKIYSTAELHIGDLKARLLDSDLVMGFDFIDKPNYMRFPFYYNANLFFLRHDVRHDYQRNERECRPKDKKHFACFLVANCGYEGYDFNGAVLRNRLFHKLSLYKNVVSGGKCLNNINSLVPRGQSQTSEWLSQCKFTIAYENNVKYPGYVTEKPFQPWFAGSIPLYNTAPEGLVDINKKAVIYAGDFTDEDDLVEYIKKVDNDDELYCSIWNEHIIDNPEKDYEVAKAQLKKKVEEIFAKKIKK